MKMVLMTVLLVLALLTPVVLGQEKSSKPVAEKSAPAKVQNVKPEQFDALRKADTNSTVVLDVRTTKEYGEGHIPGSVMIDFNAPDFDQQVARLDRKSVV